MARMGVAVVLFRDVVADGASGRRAKQGVVVGEVAGDPADDGALDAASGVSRAGAGAGGHGEGENEGKRFHRRSLWLGCELELASQPKAASMAKARR
jgi:hypothetical protein